MNNNGNDFTNEPDPWDDSASKRVFSAKGIPVDPSQQQNQKQLPDIDPNSLFDSQTASKLKLSAKPVRATGKMLNQKKSFFKTTAFKIIAGIVGAVIIIAVGAAIYESTDSYKISHAYSCILSNDYWSAKSALYDVNGDEAYALKEYCDLRLEIQENSSDYVYTTDEEYADMLESLRNKVENIDDYKSSLSSNVGDDFSKIKKLLKEYDSNTYVEDFNSEFSGCTGIFSEFTDVFEAGKSFTIKREREKAAEWKKSYDAADVIFKEAVGESIEDSYYSFDDFMTYYNRLISSMDKGAKEHSETSSIYYTQFSSPYKHYDTVDEYTAALDKKINGTLIRNLFTDINNL